MKKKRVCALLLAGGSGSRMNLSVTKQRLIIKGKSVLQRALTAFECCEDVTDIILVAREDELEFARAEAKSCSSKVRKVVVGGKNRVESAKNGFLAIDFDTDFVAVHDVARCLIKKKMITDVIRDAEKYGAGTVFQESAS